MITTIFRLQVLFIFFARILVIAGSAVNPLIYATTILKFKEAIGNVRKSLAPVKRKKALDDILVN